MNKEYAGKRYGPGGMSVTVRKVETATLPHHVRHSPDGFSWGYGGSGPSELARCILFDYFGSAPHQELYQKFKRDFVAKWEEEWTITDSEIHRWLEANPDIPRNAPSSNEKCDL